MTVVIHGGLASELRRAARRRVLLLLVAEVAFVAGVAALVLSLAHPHDRRSLVVGILCVLFGTGMYAAPLSVMVRVAITPTVSPTN